MTPMLRRSATLVLPLLAALLVATCRERDPVAPDPGPEPPSPPVVIVDPERAPVLEALPGFEDGPPRPLASTTDEDGVQSDFVADELWLSTDDEAVLEAFLARWDGEVVATFDPAELELDGLDELAPQYLVRVNASPTNAERLGRLLRELDPDGTGEYTVSSEEGLALMAAAAAEAAAGLRVGINWVGAGQDFRAQQSLEAPAGPRLGSIDYDPNAFHWPYHAAGTTQDIGVAEAWRALDLAGRLRNRVPIAILDMGFQPDDDTPAGWIALSNVPFVNPVGTRNTLRCSAGPCPWHGTKVLSAAMALPGNEFGSAGPAGPVARPILVYTLYDHFTSMRALGEARSAGARIANMSYEVPIPDYLAWTAVPFDVVTAVLARQGLLMFAAAGNDGRDVNAQRCVGIGRFRTCWEKRIHTPCQNTGVICVGGLAPDSRSRHGSSNFGESVDIYAPYDLWLGPDPENDGNIVQVEGGTSYSSPFVAGVAALVWAADPSLSARDVARLLDEAAHPSPDPNVPRTVNALGAVLAAMGNVPPAVRISSPANGAELQLNRTVSLFARADDYEDGDGCCTVTWSSDVDGELGATTAPHTLHQTFTTEGRRVITAEAEDSGGATGAHTIVVTVVNSPPEVEILRPQDGDEAFRGATVLLRGEARDPNEPGGTLACDRLEWTSDVEADPLPATGCEVEVAFASDGPRTLTLTGTDTQGATGSDAVEIVVVEPPPVLPPTARILEPEHGSTHHKSHAITFRGSATDPEGETELDFAWFVTYSFHGGGPFRQRIGSGTEFTWVPEDALPVPACSWEMLTIELEVTNPGGATGSDSIEIFLMEIC